MPDVENPGPARADAKKKTQHAAEQERADVAAARVEWRDSQPKLNPIKLVFLDETWVTTSMARRYGRGPRGQRVIGRVPHGHWMILTFLAGLRHDGITAPCLFDGASMAPSTASYSSPTSSSNSLPRWPQAMW